MKPEPVIETLLEMHFHPAIVNLMLQRHGTKTVRMLKPAPGKEAFLGFDQGWVHADPATVDLLAEIESFASFSGVQPKIYIAYFLQFKTVDKMLRRSRLLPKGFTRPYFRSEIRLQKSKNALFSQHDLLLRLATIPSAQVYYACGMMFSVDEVWHAPDLGRLRLIDIRNAPKFASGRHFIAFQKPDGPASWCSDPVPAGSVTPVEWAGGSRRSLLTAVELLALLEDAHSAARGLRLPSATLADTPIPERVARLRRLWPKSGLARLLTVLRLGPDTDGE